MKNTIVINDRIIGTGDPTYIIAELSANHLQDLGRAREIVAAAASAGADALKLQTYTADTITIDSNQDPFIVGEGTIWAGKKLYDLYAAAHTPWEWHAELIELSHSLGMDCFSSPFDGSSIEFLESLDVPAYKVASFELVDIPLIRRIAATNRPIILSTGMATLGEIESAAAAARSSEGGFALLRTNSGYPAPVDEMNLANIPHLKHTFQCPVGLSDHTLTTDIPVAAVALGASIIEKHLTLKRSDGGPDGAFSLEPDEFQKMVSAVRQTEKAIGAVNYEGGSKENASRAFRRSLFAVKDIAAGEKLTLENVRSIRPADGLPPTDLDRILGKVARIDIKFGTPLNWELIS